MSSVTDFLPRFAARKYADSRVSLPSVSRKYGGPQLRVSSPTRGLSILMTSAPRSARICPHHGPASTRLMSSTRICDSAPARSVDCGEDPLALELSGPILALDCRSPALPARKVIAAGAREQGRFDHQLTTVRHHGCARPLWFDDPDDGDRRLVRRPGARRGTGACPNDWQERNHYGADTQTARPAAAEDHATVYVRAAQPDPGCHAAIGHGRSGSRGTA